MAEGKSKEAADEEIAEVLDAIERGISNMEKRITHIDSEYSKYIKATVSRLEYLLNNDDNTKGNIIELLHLIGRKNKNEILADVGKKINFQDLTIVSQDSFYKKKLKRVFEETVSSDETYEELTRDQVLRMNKINQRYTSEDIEQFVFEKMQEGIFSTDNFLIENEKQFELLILAYDYGIRRHSPYTVSLEDNGFVIHGKYQYPKLTFRTKAAQKAAQERG